MSTSRVTYIGHATCLVEVDGVSILTDPVFSDRVLTVRRRSPLPIPINRIPMPSAVVISHAHYDHLDVPTLKYFPSTIPIVTALGLGRLIGKFVRNPIIEIAHEGTEEILPGLRITAFPVNHWGFRLSGLTYRGTNGYWIEMKGKKIFFPGDTGYREDFKSFRNPDLALLPVGPCEPTWIMRKRHLNGEDVLRVAEDIDAKLAVPIHWGVFKLGFDSLHAPIDHLRNLVDENGHGRRVTVLAPGEGSSF